MLLDMTSLPVSGGMILACAVYAGASLYAGQVVGARSIERLNWTARCEAVLKADIAAARRPGSILPKTDCRSVIGAFGTVFPELRGVCDRHGNPDLGGARAEAARRAERRRREFEERRLAQAAVRAGTRCECAATLYVEERMIPLAFYAGSARLITPSGVKAIESELVRFLSAPPCAAAGEAEE